jgi:hypothetical protein
LHRCPSLLEYIVKETMMLPGKKRTKDALKLRMEEDLRRQHEAEAENRRKLLASLDPRTREMARRDFAKLGLHQ